MISVQDWLWEVQTPYNTLTFYVSLETGRGDTTRLLVSGEEGMFSDRPLHDQNLPKAEAHRWQGYAVTAIVKAMQDLLAAVRPRRRR